MAKYFKLKEFACKGKGCCGASHPISQELIDGLDRLRELIDKPIVVTSGFRCRAHNSIIGGAANSYHTMGMAADIVCKGVRPSDIREFAERVDVFRKGGIIVYSNFVHLDVRKSGPYRSYG
jgi:zinc D-Ala-D-Ala carboxypeptidase